MVMAKRTIELRKIIDSGYPLFDFDYPMVAGHREQLEEKIVDHYYFHEINFETVDMFKQRLKSKLNMIMPYYVQMYKSECLVQHPLVSEHLVESFSRVNDVVALRTATNYDRVNETTLDRITNTMDFTSTEDFGANEQGTADGTLDRATMSNEVMDRETTLDTDTTATSDRDTTVDTTQKVVLDESTSGSKTTMFSDTPQQNFVVGDGVTNPDGSYTPISMYATTYTSENTTGTKDSEQNTTGVSTENMGQTDKGTVDTTENVTQTNNASSQQDDVTHNEHEVDRTSKTDFVSNNKSSGQNATDREAYTVGTDSSKRDEKYLTDHSKKLVGIKGKSESELLNLFRTTFINVDKLIIGDLSVLFLGVY